MKEVSPLPEMSREELLKILWGRVCDETKSHHSVTLRYLQLLVEMMGWEKPEPKDIQYEVVIGGYLDS